MKIGFFEKNAKSGSEGPQYADCHYLPYASIEYFTTKETINKPSANKKKVLVEKLLNPSDFNFAELETYNCR